MLAMDILVIFNGFTMSRCAFYDSLRVLVECLTLRTFFMAMASFLFSSIVAIGCKDILRVIRVELPARG